MEAHVATDYRRPNRPPAFPSGASEGGRKFERRAGIPAFLSGDYGMGAVTDNGSGDYTLAFDTVFADTNYWACALARDFDEASNSGVMVTPKLKGTKTNSSIQVSTLSADGGFNDVPDVGISFGGDYA
jgi:hypothetical protein